MWRVGAARSAAREDWKLIRNRRGGQHKEMRGCDGWQIRLERFRDTVAAQIDVDVVVLSLLVAMVRETTVVAAMNCRRRLLAVETQMHVRMRISDAREENGERGKLYRVASNVHVVDSSGQARRCNVSHRALRRSC
jgi:hypothetical protein